MKLISEFLFWLHLIIFIGWFVPFAIPLSTWPARITFHFWYIAIQVASQLLTGLLMMKNMKKFRIVCPLTTIMQKIRGFDYGNKLNFDHSFVREFAKRLRIRIPYGWVAVLIYATFVVVALQYLGIITS